MAKFRPVPSLSPEEFLGGAANAGAIEATAPLTIVSASTPTVEQPRPSALNTSSSSPSAETGEDELVSVTIRIKRRHHDRLMKLAATEERSLAQVARRLLEPVIDSE